MATNCYVGKLNMELLEKWIYECLGALIKEPTEENRKIVAKTIASEIEDRETWKKCYYELKSKEKGTKITNHTLHTSEEIKYRLSDLGVQIGSIAIEYITELEK